MGTIGRDLQMVQMHKQLEPPPSYPDWVFPSLRGQEVACWCCGTNQEESYHAQMSVAVYKTNSGHLQGHLEGARHTQAHIHTYTPTRTHLCIWAEPSNETASYVNKNY